MRRKKYEKKEEKKADRGVVEKVWRENTVEIT
jgi:hypothetical protein